MNKVCLPDLTSIKQMKLKEEKLHNRLLSLVLIVALMQVMFVPAVKGASTQTLGPGKMSYVVATIAGGPQTVDPAMANDGASNELIQNVYDPLVFFKTTTVSDVVPWLADAFMIDPNGLWYTFHIRPNVPWQDPAYGFVTPEDVEYSLERVLVRDYTGGPAWMFWLPIFGQLKADIFQADGVTLDPAKVLAQGIAIDNAITRNDVTGTVTIQFAPGRPPFPSFLSNMAQTVGSILSKQWAIDNGDWNSAIDRLDDGTWVNAHDPPAGPSGSPSSLDDPYAMMGSGPFEFNYLNEAVSWSIIRNGGQEGSVAGTIVDPHPTTVFWGGWGANRLNLLGFFGVVSRGYVDEIVEYFIADYAVRLIGFLSPLPIYDTIPVSWAWADFSMVWHQPGVKCIYPIIRPGDPDFYLRAARDWVHGWYYNPNFPGSPGVSGYGYSIWKEDIFVSGGTFAGKYANWEDINEDGRVDIKDLATAAKAYGAYFIYGPPVDYTPNWDSRADVYDYYALTLRPNEAGTYQEWYEFGSPPSHWEGTRDGMGTTGVESPSGNTAATETENLEDTALNGRIISVTAYATAQAIGSGDEQMEILWFTSGGPLVPSTSFLVDTNSILTYFDRRTTNLIGNQWTLADVNALQIGSRASVLDSSEIIQASEYWIVVLFADMRGDMKVDIKDLATMAKMFGFQADPWVPGP